MKFFSSLLLIAYCLLPIVSFSQTKPEFRGVWVATVENIDWPSKRGLSNEDQKKEFIALLDRHQKICIKHLILYAVLYSEYSSILLQTDAMAPKSDHASLSSN